MRERAPLPDQVFEPGFRGSDWTFPWWMRVLRDAGYVVARVPELMRSRLVAELWRRGVQVTPPRPR
jgi:hypothetical protein